MIAKDVAEMRKEIDLISEKREALRRESVRIAEKIEELERHDGRGKSTDNQDRMCDDCGCVLVDFEYETCNECSVYRYAQKDWNEDRERFMREIERLNKDVNALRFLVNELQMDLGYKLSEGHEYE